MSRSPSYQLRRVALAGATALLALPPAAAQEHHLDGPVALAFDVRHEGRVDASLVLVDAVASAEASFSLYGVEQVLPGTNNQTRRLHLVARAITTGELLWKSDLSLDPDVLEDPLGLVVTPDGASVFVLLQREGGFLVAPASAAATLLRFDAATGASEIVAVSTALNGFEGKGLALASDGSTLVVAGDRGTSASLEAFDITTGASLWLASNPALGRLHAFAVGGNAAYTSSGGGTVTAFDLADGSVSWTFAPSGPMFPFDLSAAENDARLAVRGLSFGGPGNLIVLDGATGALDWAQPSGPRDFVLSPDGALAVGVVRFGAGVGTPTTLSVTGYVAATGEVLWHRDLDFADFMGVRDLAWNARTGTALLSLSNEAPVNDPAGSPESLLAALDGPTGAVRWMARGSLTFEHVIAVGARGTRVVLSGKPALDDDADLSRQVAYDAFTGERLWDRHLLETAPTVEEPLAFALTPDGATLLTTGVALGTEPNSKVLAHDVATGDELWVRTEEIGSFQGGRDLVVDPDGTRFFVRATLDNLEVVEARSVLDGALLWRAELVVTVLPDSASGAGGLIYLPARDRVVLARHLAVGGPFPFDSAIALTALDGASGATDWEVLVDPSGFEEVAYGLAAAPDESALFLAASTLGVGTFSEAPLVVALDPSDGAELWSVEGPADVFGHAVDVHVSPDGERVFAVVNLGPGELPLQHYVLGLDAANGDELWRSSSATHFGVHDSVLAAAGNRLAVTGQRYELESGKIVHDFATGVLDLETGARLWQAEFDSGASDVGHGVTFSVNGAAVIATGGTGTGPFGDPPGAGFLTRSYATENGALLWSASYGDPAVPGGAPLGVVTAPGRRAVVVGLDASFDVSLFAYDSAPEAGITRSSRGR